MADYIGATPQNPLLGLLYGGYDYLRSPQRTQQMQGLANLLESTGIPKTIERMSYGEPLTNIGRANVPLLKPETAEAMMTVAPMAGPAARGAGRLVGSQINRAMLGEGGLLAPITPQPMFAAPQSIARKSNLTPSLQIEDKVLPITMHKLEEKAGNQIVNINPETFDKAFSKTDWQYVGKGGEGGIEGRYKGFENWLKDAKSMTASNVSVNKDGGVVFGDGRHRYAVLRDMGLDKLPISMDKESIKNAKKFGYIADETSFQYPQQEALNLAQQRAALPVEQGGLGLLAENTPEMRAKAMGFETPVYHATEYDFSSIRPSSQGKMGGGVYTSFDPTYAERYASGKNANTMPLLTRGEMATPEIKSDVSEIVRQQMLKENPDFNLREWKARSNQMLANQGYSGLDVDKERLIFNPSDLRSRFAAFDPFRKDVATATAMGVALPDLLATENNQQPQSTGLLYPLP
jgi:hypothetical protein